jgi:hypothetical protein
VCTANSNDWRPFAEKYGAERALQIIGRVRWMADRGVRLITGADAGMARFDNFPAALRALEDWGFSRDQILEMATVTTADALGSPLLLQTWPERPGVSLNQVDAVPLTWQRTAAVRNTDLPVRGGQGETL